MARLPSAERRRQLTEAAIRAMTRDGVPRTTTRSIAAEAGVSLSVFHYCFESKQELIESVITTITGHYVTLVREAIRPRGTLRETVRAGFQAYWDHVSAHPGEHMLTYELTQYCLRKPGYAEVARQQYDAYAQAFLTLFSALGAEAAETPEIVGHYLAATIDGVTIDWLVRRDDSCAERVLDLMARHIDDVLLMPEQATA